MSREVSVAEIPILDLNHCLSSSINEISAMGVLHTYEANSVRSSKACSGSLSRIAYFCNAATRPASFVEMTGASTFDLVPIYRSVRRIILHLAGHRHYCFRTRGIACPGSATWRQLRWHPNRYNVDATYSPFSLR